MELTLRELANRATVREAADIIGVDVDMLHSAVSAGTVPTIGVDRGRRLVDLEDVEAWKSIRESGIYASGHDILHLRAMGHDVPSIARLMKIAEDSVARFFKRQRAKCFQNGSGLSS